VTLFGLPPPSLGRETTLFNVVALAGCRISDKVFDLIKTKATTKNIAQEAAIHNKGTRQRLRRRLEPSSIDNAGGAVDDDPPDGIFCQFSFAFQLFAATSHSHHGCLLACLGWKKGRGRSFRMKEGLFVEGNLKETEASRFLCDA